MKKNIYKLVALLLVLGLFTFSCDKTALPDVDVQSPQDNAQTEVIVGDVFNLINNALNTPGKATEVCAIVDPDLVSKILTITFPEPGCTGTDGRLRKGVITATFNQNFQGEWAAGSYVTITFTNYSVNGNVLTGTMIATCNALEPNPVFTLASNGYMTLTFTDEKTTTWKFETTYTMLTGFDTPTDKTDDTWQINGISEGKGRNGKDFTSTSVDLTTSPDCKYFVSGVINLIVDESDTYKLEFLETCGSVKITYNDLVFNKTLE